MTTTITKTVLSVLLILAVGNPSLAQRTTATFGGTVEDQSHAVLPGVQVSLINEGTSVALEQLSNERGEFLFDFVPVGIYTLKLNMPGFKNLESRGNSLGAAQTVRRTYSMEVGGLTDEVTVTGEAAQVNTVSPEQRLALDTLQVTSLPMINRNVTTIIAAAGTGLSRNDLTSNTMGGTRYKLNGLGGGSMSATVDGGSASGDAGSEMLGMYGNFAKIEVMSAEAIGEVQIVKGVISSEYGGMGGHVSMVTKSGTNEWHGSLMERYSGSALDARSPFLSRKPNSVGNQFGGSLAGPIKHDKAFFLLAYEGYRVRATVPVNGAFPTPYFRNLLLQYLPYRETQVNLNYMPIPNQPYGPTDLLGRWIGPGESTWNDDHVDARADYLLGPGNLSVTFAGGHPNRNEAADDPLETVRFTSRVVRLNVGYVVGKGRLTSSTRMGMNHVPQVRIEKTWYEYDPSHEKYAKGFGIINKFSYPGMTTTRGGLRRVNKWPSWTAEQQLSWLTGPHALKFGAMVRLKVGGFDNQQAGNVAFNTLSDIQNNTPNAVTLGRSVPSTRWSMPSYSFYVQDDWRITPKLVLNVGLREDNYYAIKVTPAAVYGGASAYEKSRAYDNQPGTAAWNLDGLLDPVNFAWGGLRNRNKPYENDYWNFGPRFGFAYTPNSKGDFVVRGGFGVNFAGFDAGPQEEGSGQIARPDLPATKTWSRLESAALGLKFPAYNDDLALVALAENKIGVTRRINPHYESPYAMNYTLGIQRALTPSLVLESAFVGSRGVKFVMVRTFNRVDRVTGLRPNPGDIQGSYNDNSQQTNFNSWQTSLRQRFARGLGFNVHYTWGKAMSYSGGDIAEGWVGDGTRNSIEDFNEVKIERSLSTGDITHNFSTDWVYSVPTLLAGSRVARTVLGGWQLTGIFAARTGIPIFTGITQTGGRPDLIDPANMLNKNCCSFGNIQYINPAAFVRLPIPTASGLTIRRGNINSSPVRAPGMWNVDLSLGKSVSLTELVKVELRADMLNAFNHTTYTNFATNLSGIDFGKATATGPARMMQLQMRLKF
jgi:Carboxypeptidase regulatory-like domain/TonB dependent receptor